MCEEGLRLDPYKTLKIDDPFNQSQYLFGFAIDWFARSLLRCKLLYCFSQQNFDKSTALWHIYQCFWSPLYLWITRTGKFWKPWTLQSGMATRTALSHQLGKPGRACAVRSVVKERLRHLSVHVYQPTPSVHRYIHSLCSQVYPLSLTTGTPRPSVQRYTNYLVHRYTHSLWPQAHPHINCFCPHVHPFPPFAGPSTPSVYWY